MKRGHIVTFKMMAGFSGISCPAKGKAPFTLTRTRAKAADSECYE